MLSLIIFISCYLLFVVFTQWRTIIACSGAAILILSQEMQLRHAITEVIQWNVIGLFFGTLILAELFMLSRMPAVIAEWFIDKSKTARGAIVTICLLSSFISAFVENVAVVLIVAPIAITLCKKIDVSPVKPMIFLTMFTNLQGTATLIGDPPSMIVGGYMKMSFNDFFIYQDKLSIFFIIQVAAVAATILVFYLLRHLKQPIKLIPQEKPKSLIPSILLIMFVLILACGSFFDPDFKWFAGTAAMSLGVFGLIWHYFGPHWTTTQKLIRKLDWDTSIFLIALFVLVGSLQSSGWIDAFSKAIIGILNGELLLTFIIIIAFSVVISAFVDNVPYLLTMIPVVQSIAIAEGAPLVLLVFALLIGACLGGNLTPIGASANIVAVGLLKKEGYELSFPHYMKYGILFVAVSVITSSVALWYIWR